MFLTAAALALSLTAPGTLAGFTEGAPAFDNRACFSQLTQTMANSIGIRAGVQQNFTAHTPKAGDFFFVELTIASASQPCNPSLSVHPGFKLPPGWSFASTADGAPHTQCLVGTNEDALSQVSCPAQPTLVANDGTLFFDFSPSATWRLDNDHVLRILVPVRANAGGSATVRAHVEWHLGLGSSSFLATESTVQATTFLKTPEVSAPTPAFDNVRAHTAHLLGFVDPHFNAGTITLSVGKVGQLNLNVVDAVHVNAGELDTGNVDTNVDALDADSDYKFQWAFQIDGGIKVSGPVLTFHTQPLPHFALTVQKSGDGDGNVFAGVDVVSAPADIVEDQSLTLSAHASEGSHLTRFVVNGFDVVASGTDNVTIIVSGPVTAEATFERDPPPASDPGPGPEAGSDNGGDNGGSGDNGGDTVGDNGSGDNGSGDNGNGGSVEDGGEDGGEDSGIRNQIRITDGNGDDGSSSSDDGAAGCASTRAGSAPIIAVLALLAAVGARRRRR